MLAENLIQIPEGYTRTSEGDVLPPLHLLAEDVETYTKFKIFGTPIEGLLVWERMDYFDDRGDVQEVLKVGPLEEVLGRDILIKQVMRSRNQPRGVLRGLHAEPMDKIITPDIGNFFIAIADISSESNTFGEVVTFEIDNTDLRKPTRSIFVANGLANSFLTIGREGSIPARYFYAASKGYKTSEDKRSVAWDDPDLNIAWPIQPTIMSDVDRYQNPTLRQLFPDRLFGDQR